MTTDSSDRREVVGSDGLPARESGEHAKRKLAFINHYCPVAIDATEKKYRRRYIDLFAGPGLNRIRGTNEEVDGGALRVLASRGQLHPELSFDEAFLVNLETIDHAALKARVERAIAEGRCMVPPSRIHHERGNANQLLPRLLAQCHQLDYVLTFADIEAPSQLPWSTVEIMTSHGHKSVDLYVLFPLEMGLNRLMPYRDMPPGHQAILNAFFGVEDWKRILAERFTEAQSADCMRKLEELYLDRLRTRWTRAFKLFNVMRVGRKGMYRMLFATSHAAGEKIADWARKQTEASDQTKLELRHDRKLSWILLPRSAPRGAARRPSE